MRTFFILNVIMIRGLIFVLPWINSYLTSYAFTALSNFAEIYCEPLLVLKTSFEQSNFFEANASVNAAIAPSVIVLVSNEYPTHS